MTQKYWGILKKKKNYLQELVRRGIPHHFRGLAWQLLLGVHDSPHKQLYVEYLKQTSPSEKLIRRDIARTFPDHDFFKEKDGLGQESLFNVMKVSWLLSFWSSTFKDTGIHAWKNIFLYII